MLVPSFLFLLLPSASSGVCQQEPSRTPWIRSAQDLLAFIEPADAHTLDLQKAYGYAFTLSSDERWLALLSSGAELEKTLYLAHLPSGRSWNRKVTESDPLDHIGRWVPDCFSADGTQLHYGQYSAALSPEMGALVFEDRGDPFDRPAGVCLGLSRPIKNAAGEEVAGLYKLSQHEGEWGEIVWSSDGRVLYEACGKEGRCLQFLRVTPPGEQLGIRYERLLELENERVESELESELKNMETVPPGMDPEMWKEMARKIAETARQTMRVDASTARVDLSQLALAPDRGMLAALAKVGPRDQETGRSYAVLIPLERGGLEAFPLASNCYGKLVWGRDSRSLYVRGHRLDAPEEADGILRLELDLLALPTHIEPAAIPGDRER